MGFREDAEDEEEVVLVFTDRAEAGWLLAVRLAHLRDQRPVVLGLPRGGMPVAYQVARALDAPLEVLVVRKLGVPSQPELAMGAVGEGGVVVVDDDVVRRAGVSADQLAEVEARAQAAVADRVRRYRGGRPGTSVAGRVAVVVDDGLATGAIARAGCEAARAAGAARVVLAVPVAPPGWEEVVGPAADEFVCLDTPTWFFAVGQFYEDFRQVREDEVAEYLERAAGRATVRPHVAAKHGP